MIRPSLSRRYMHRLCARLCAPALVAALASGAAGCLSGEDSLNEYSFDEDIGAAEEAMSAFNIARGKPTMQSSTYSNDSGSSVAADGNTDGNFGHHSVTHTNYQNQPWWRVDLGVVQPLSSVTLWNRTDCCGTRLSNFVIEVSDDLSVWRTAASYGGAAPTTLNLPLTDVSSPTGAYGRYLRVRLLGTDYLSLAEVQVFGSLTLGKVATQSSTVGAFTANRAIDGDVGQDPTTTSFSATQWEYAPWWQVDLGSLQGIGSVVVWNGPTNAQSPLANFLVSLSADGQTWRDMAYMGNATRFMTFNVNQGARYVRIERLGSGPLNLNEVQVLPAPQESGYVRVTDFSGGAPGSVPYQQYWGDTEMLTGWIDPSDAMFSGDFMGLGHAQAFYMNRSGNSGKIMIVDYAGGASPGAPKYFESWGQSAILDGWIDSGDIQLAGDFMGLGHSQLMFINRGGSYGKILILDYASGLVPGVPRYIENWGQNGLLDGWLDSNDQIRVGDFMGLGHSQVMFINRGGAGGKVMIVDYAGGAAPGSVKYWEDWGQNGLLNGWLDNDDMSLVGDFMGLGHSQMMFINRGGSGGKVMVVDYAGGAVPGAAKYWESWGQNGILGGWLDTGDAQIVGDFMGLGHSQVMFYNAQNNNDGKLMVQDYASGTLGGVTTYFESWLQSGSLDGYLASGDPSIVGDFTGAHHTQMLSFNVKALPETGIVSSSP